MLFYCKVHTDPDTYNYKGPKNLCTSELGTVCLEAKKFIRLPLGSSRCVTTVNDQYP